MYIPKAFEIKETEEMYAIIDKNGFATLFSTHGGEPCATHLPLLLDRESGVLYGHFAYQNSQWHDLREQIALAVFHGPHCYISPAWYETQETVPTWNYTAVHVYGKVERLTDEDEMMGTLQRLVEKYEEPNSGYELNDVEPSVVAGLTKGILPFKMTITKMEGKAKLSQNHSAERRAKVVSRLEVSGSEQARQIGRLMKNLDLQQ